MTNPKSRKGSKVPEKRKISGQTEEAVSSDQERGLLNRNAWMQKLQAMYDEDLDLGDN